MSINFDPGELDRRINIETRSVARDADTGGDVETWTPAPSDVSAKVLESSTNRGLGDTGDAVSTYAKPTRIWLRWQSGILPESHRVRYKGELLRIIGSAELGRRAGIELSCMEWAHE